MKASEAESPTLDQGRGHALLRILLASFLTGVAALLAAGFWVVGQGQYLQDYCFTRVELPQTSPPEALSGRPAHWADPVTVACEFDGFSTIYTTGPAPLIGALLLAAVVIAVALVTFRWAWAAKGRQDV